MKNLSILTIVVTICLLVSCKKKEILIEQDIVEIDEKGTLTYYNENLIKNGIIELPESVKTIGNKVFMNNEKLVKITGSRVTKINILAFSSCKNLEVCNFENLEIIEGQAFEQCEKLQELNFLKLEDIGNRAFVKCGMIKNIDVPNIQKIGKHAFSGCDSIQNLKIGKEIPRTEKTAFSSTPKTKKLTATNNIEDIIIFQEWAYRHSFQKLNNQVINSDLFAPKGMLSEGKKIIYVNKPEAFDSGKPVVIPPFFNEIGDELFAMTGTYSFRRIKAKGVVKIGNKTFSNACNLYEIDFPLLKETGEKAFEVCLAFEDVYLPKLEKLGASAFFNCSYTRNISLPSVKEIGSFAFSQCKRLEKLRLGAVPPEGKDSFGGLKNNDFNGKIPILEIPEGTRSKYNEWKYRDKFVNIVEYKL